MLFLFGMCTILLIIILMMLFPIYNWVQKEKEARVEVGQAQDIYNGVQKEKEKKDEKGERNNEK